MCAGCARTGPLAVVPLDRSARSLISGAVARGGGTRTPGNEPGNEAEGVADGAGGDATPVSAKATGGTTQEAATKAKETAKRRATCRAAVVSGIDLPNLLGAVTRDVPPIDETQRRFFHAAFINCIRTALMKCAT